MISAFVRSSTSSEPKDAWFFGNFDDITLKCLKHLQSKNETIVYPGVMSGWASAQEAKDNSINWSSEEKKASYIARYEYREDLEDQNMVMFKINAKTFTGVVNREYVHRLNAKFEDYQFTDGVHEFTLTEQDPMSFADWSQKYPDAMKEE